MKQTFLLMFCCLAVAGSALATIEARAETRLEDPLTLKLGDLIPLPMEKAAAAVVAAFRDASAAGRMPATVKVQWRHFSLTVSFETWQAYERGERSLAWIAENAIVGFDEAGLPKPGIDAEDLDAIVSDGTGGDRKPAPERKPKAMDADDMTRALTGGD